MTILLSQIDRTDRERKQYGNVPALGESIAEIGLGHPIVITTHPIPGTLNKTTNEEYLYKLVAGGRRCAAADYLEITEVHDNTTCEPGKIGFVLKENMSEDEILEMELEE